jgi:hypothetical protein
VRGDEDHRRVLGAGRWRIRVAVSESVQARHVDVEQHHGERLPQQAAQRVAAGFGLDDGDVEVLQHRAQGGALGDVVVDHQHRRRVALVSTTCPAPILTAATRPA